ncbi:MAG: dihydrofolate reductase family protein [Planctomycetia bacterium]
MVGVSAEPGAAPDTGRRWSYFTPRTPRRPVRVSWVVWRLAHISGKNTMRRIILDIAVSLDGRIAGPNGELDWLIFDDETAQFTNDNLLNDVDSIIYGRKAFELFGSQPIDPAASKPQQTFQDAVTRSTKYVFSQSLSTVAPTVSVIRGGLPAAVRTLKSQPGKDIWLCGGAALVSSFAREQLIDEYRLSVHPIVLGAGKLLFHDSAPPVHLNFLGAHTLSNGVLATRYEPTTVA